MTDQDKYNKLVRVVISFREAFSNAAVRPPDYFVWEDDVPAPLNRTTSICGILIDQKISPDLTKVVTQLYDIIDKLLDENDRPVAKDDPVLCGLIQLVSDIKGETR